MDPQIAELCRERLWKLGVPRCNIKVGDALKDESYEFDDSLENTPIMYFKIEDLGSLKLNLIIEINNAEKTKEKNVKLDCINIKEDLLNKLFELFDTAICKDFYIVSEKIDARLKLMNALFKKYLGKKLQFNKNKIIALI